MSPFPEIERRKVPRYQVGGALSWDAPSYVQRKSDDELYYALLSGELCYIFNSRQMGKSSLQVRTIYRLQDSGVRCATLDLATLGTQEITVEQWYASIIHTLIKEFNLNLNFKVWWEEHQAISLIQKVSTFFEEVLLSQIQKSIVILIDEVDSVLGLSFSTDDFFTLIRGCYSKRTPSSAYKRLTFALFGVSTPSGLIEDKRKTPLNFGKAIALHGITLSEATPLMAGFQGVVSNSEIILKEILDWTGGQPFLTQKLCQLVLQEVFSLQKSSHATNTLPNIKNIVQKQIIDQWESQDEPEHLRTVRDRILCDELNTVRLLDLYLTILEGQENVSANDSVEQLELRLSGLVVNRNGFLSVRNPIYQYVFSCHWVKAQLEHLRPYSKAMEKWIVSGRSREDYLLQGQKLYQAQVWATDKNLSSLDYQFLAASTAFEYRLVQQALDVERASTKMLQLDQATSKQFQFNHSKNKLFDLGLILPRYQFLEEIYRNNYSIFYRAQHKTDGTRVIVKTTTQDPPSVSTITKLRTHNAIIQQLQHEGIIRHIGLEPYQNSYALVSEDFGGISLRDWIKNRNHLENSIEIILQKLKISITLSDILHYLQQRNITHKDIHTGNILIHPKTQQVKLIDFGCATQLTREVQHIQSPYNLGKTLLYCSPEQTGWMNRSVDYRSDFYSLGVTLFELFAGEHYLQIADPIEMLQTLLFQSVPWLRERCPSVPEAIAQIIHKLMSKYPEDRYQSALGLCHDLEYCQESLNEKATIHAFGLAQQDWCDHLLIPEKLYGRTQETRTLLKVFEQVAQGSSAIVMISGNAGVGKTALVKEVQKFSIAQRGYFIQGKFERLNSGIPFSGFVQAFRHLIQQLLSESQDQKKNWKKKLENSLEDKAQIMIDVIPELEQIIGKQPAVQELLGQAAQKRFYRLFQKLIKTFSTPEHPLIVFFDNLHWADSASLNLIEQISIAQQSCLLLIGAYREDDILSNHEFISSLEFIRNTKSNYQLLILEPLGLNQLNHWISETLKCSSSISYPLSNLIFQKTQGNPFYFIQLILSLHKNGCIKYNYLINQWQCDLSDFGEIILTNDVLKIIKNQLNKLPKDTLRLIKVAACLGNQFDLSTLSIVLQKSRSQTSRILWRAIHEGILLPQNDIYKLYISSKQTDQDPTSSILSKLPQEELDLLQQNYHFLHDRVQQAAYALIPETKKKTKHLQIARLLLSEFSIEKRTKHLFDLVNQFNRGSTLIYNKSERYLLSKLNLEAAEKAQAATAHQAALVYAQTGIDLLRFDGWLHQYSTCLRLYHIATEAAFLSGESDKIFNYSEIALKHAQSPIDMVPVYETQIRFCTTSQNYKQAIYLGIKILEILGVKIPKKITKIQILIKLIINQLALKTEFIKSKNQKIISPETSAIFRILDLLLYPCYHASKYHLAFIGLTGLNLSILRGDSVWAASFYSVYSIMLIDFKRFKKSYEIGQLALRLINKFHNPQIDAKVKFCAAFFSQPCAKKISDSLPLIQSAAISALDNGDSIYFGLCNFAECTVRFLLGEPLDKLAPILEKYIQPGMLRDSESNYHLISVLSQVVAILRNPTGQISTLFGSEEADAELIVELKAKNEIATLSSIYAYKQYLAFLFGDIEKALLYSKAHNPYQKCNSATYSNVNTSYVEGLISLAAYGSCSSRQQQHLLRRLNKIQYQLKQRAMVAPYNIQFYCDLLQAERYRVFGKRQPAIPLYDKAIEDARSRNYYPGEAVANECAAKFYLEWRKDRVAQVYIKSAYECWDRWGCLAKVRDLENRYPGMV